MKKVKKFEEYETDDVWFFEEILRNDANKQCICGGWAISCECDDVVIGKKIKDELWKYVEAKEAYEKDMNR